MKREVVAFNGVNYESCTAMEFSSSKERALVTLITRTGIEYYREVVMAEYPTEPGAYLVDWTDLVLGGEYKAQWFILENKSGAICGSSGHLFPDGYGKRYRLNSVKKAEVVE